MRINSRTHSTSFALIDQRAAVPIEVSNDSQVQSDTLSRFKQAVTALQSSLHNEAVTAHIDPNKVEHISTIISVAFDGVGSTQELNFKVLSGFLLKVWDLTNIAQPAKPGKSWTEFKSSARLVLLTGNELVRQGIRTEISSASVSFVLAGTKEDLAELGPKLRRVMREVVEKKQVELAEKYGWTVIQDGEGKVIRIRPPAGTEYRSIAPPQNIDDPLVCKNIVHHLRQTIEIPPPAEFINDDRDAETDDS